MIKVFKYNELPSHLGNGQERGLFYCSTWLSVLQNSYGCQYYVTADINAGEFMIFALIKGLTGLKVVSLPFSDYTCPYLASSHSLQLHIQAIQREFPDCPVVVKVNMDHVEEKEFSSLGPMADKGSLHRVNTTADTQLDKQMAGSFRRGMRRARSRGLLFGTSCSYQSLEEFYTLFYELRMQKFGLIPQPFSFFKRVFEEFISQGRGFFTEVWKKDQLVASAVVLQYGQGLYYKWGCSSKEHLIDRPNNLMFYELLHLAQRQGYDFVDLGLSDLKANRGLIRFKKSMGGVESSIYTFKFYPEGYPSDTEDKMKSIINSMASTVVASRFDRKTTESFSKTLYPLFA